MRCVVLILTGLVLVQGGVARAEDPGWVQCSRLCWDPTPNNDASMVCKHKIQTDEDLEEVPSGRRLEFA